MCRINLWVYLACIFPLFGSSYSNFISNGALEGDQLHGGGGPDRALLQLKKKCNVSFENMDYTILTTQCKGPAYPKLQCCDALKELACPYTDEVNDMETDCAETMFSYINLYGKYPAGLFANTCKEGSSGLDCKDGTVKRSAAAAATADGGRRLLLFLLTLTVTAAILVGW